MSTSTVGAIAKQTIATVLSIHGYGGSRICADVVGSAVGGGG